MSTDFRIHAVHISLGCFGCSTLISQRVFHFLDSGILYTVKLEESRNIRRSSVFSACSSLVGISSCIVLFIREDIAFCREGVFIYFNFCYLYILCIGICLAGEIEVKLGNGANQRNLNSFALCLNLCISYVIG